MRVEVDRVEGVVEAQGAERDHRSAAEKRDAGAVEPEARNAPKRDAGIGQRENDERGEARGAEIGGREVGESHERAA